MPMELTNTSEVVVLSDKSFLIKGVLPQQFHYEISDLLLLKPEEPDTVILAGRKMWTPRFVSHYLHSYRYSGRLHEAQPLPSILRPLLDWSNERILSMYVAYMKELCDVEVYADDYSFNQALVNFYMDGHHYIGKHSDDERQLIQHSPVFSSSHGQTRTFRIRNKITNDIVEDIEMTDGSFVVMCGAMQKEFYHEVPKVMGKRGESMETRVNITFRAFNNFRKNVQK